MRHFCWAGWRNGGCLFTRRRCSVAGVRVKVCGRGLKIGDSLAVNGCCLTVVKLAKRGAFRLVRMDLLKETWRLTNLQFARAGSAVNLERSLRAGARLGGHFVTGHIDGT